MHCDLEPEGGQRWAKKGKSGFGSVPTRSGSAMAGLTDTTRSTGSRLPTRSMRRRARSPLTLLQRPAQVHLWRNWRANAVPQQSRSRQRRGNLPDRRNRLQSGHLHDRNRESSPKRSAGSARCVRVRNGGHAMPSTQHVARTSIRSAVSAPSEAPPADSTAVQGTKAALDVRSVAS